MKKFLNGSLAALFLGAVVGCGGGESTPPPAATEEAPAASEEGSAAAEEGSGTAEEAAEEEAAE